MLADLINFVFICGDRLLLGSTGLRKALKGLEKCARRSICHIHTKSGNALNPKVTLTKSSSPHTKTLSKDTTLAGTAGEGGSQCTCCQSSQHEYCVAVGVVFGMALAQRILNRYPSSDEKTNLLVSAVRAVCVCIVWLCITHSHLL